MPILKAKFTSYNDFASSSLEDVYGTHALENSNLLEATHFASSYLENLGDGKFKVITLPVQAQFSSVNDILVGDYNGDGYLDAIIAGNLHAAEVETTRNDASIGLLLTGNGKGTFSAVPYANSGLCMRNDVKQLGVINSAEKQLIFVANNNEHLQVFVRPK